jgi:hypothetical protein
MGVPRLWSFLSQGKFGVIETFPPRSGADEGFEKVHMVFDGPSFAYWLWREGKVKQGVPRYRSLG